MKLKDILKDVKIIETNVDLELDIKGIFDNSRECKENTLFLAIKGFETNGNKYIENAFGSGAVAFVTDEKQHTDKPYILVENARVETSKIANNFYGKPSKKFDVLGVTGTNGKTTTTYLLRHILQEVGKEVGLVGTNQNIIAGEVKDANRTTECALKSQEMLKKAVDFGSDALVMEVSSHALTLDRVTDIEFKIGVYTNLTQDHLDFHETIEEYAKAKSRFFKLCEYGVINIDDEYSGVMIKDATCEILTYGIENDKADLIAKNLELFSNSVKFDVSFKGENQSFELMAPGKFNVQNALGAIGAMLCYGIELSVIAKHLKTSTGVKGRVEVVPYDADFTVIIDYAHAPDGITNVLKTLKEFIKGRLIVLFGCGGDRDKTKRPLMGKAVMEYADVAIVTSDNPRTENPEDIINDILMGIQEFDKTVIIDRKDAIKYALSIGEKDDVIALLGKGHETYQEINGKKYDFDERKIILG